MKWYLCKHIKYGVRRGLLPRRKQNETTQEIRTYWLSTDSRSGLRAEEMTWKDRATRIEQYIYQLCENSFRSYLSSQVI